MTRSQLARRSFLSTFVVSSYSLLFGRSAPAASIRQHSPQRIPNPQAGVFVFDTPVTTYTYDPAGQRLHTDAVVSFEYR